MRITTVGLDADDTLWHNETLFHLTQDRFRALLADWAAADVLTARLAEVERRNLALYGYGVKGFVLSMIETAMEVTAHQAPGALVAELLDAGREMLAHPVEPLPGVEDALARLAETRRLVLITKGDLLHQEQKLAASGLGELFEGVEIVSEKDARTYERAFARHGSGAAQAVMCGNSIRSDILPALEAGAHAAWVPYPLTWAHERAEPPAGDPKFREISSLGELPDWLAELQ
jgi:putative hydrolase of the HAD superfamily